jgi:hypothetical protein
MSSPVSERMQLPTPTEIASRHAHGHVTPSESGTDRCLTERYLRALDIREL